MPKFGTVFSGLSSDRKVTDDELIRSIRFMIAAAYEGNQLCMQLVESTDNHLAKAVLKEIAGEELVHVGAFLRLLHELAPDEKKHYEEGVKEVEEIMNELEISNNDTPISPLHTVRPGRK